MDQSNICCGLFLCFSGSTESCLFMPLWGVTGDSRAQPRIARQHGLFFRGQGKRGNFAGHRSSTDLGLWCCRPLGGHKTGMPLWEKNFLLEPARAQIHPPLGTGPCAFSSLSGASVRWDIAMEPPSTAQDPEDPSGTDYPEVLEQRNQVSLGPG